MLCLSRNFWILKAILCLAPLVTFCSGKKKNQKGNLDTHLPSSLYRAAPSAVHGIAFQGRPCDQSHRNGKQRWLCQVPPKCPPFEGGRSRRPPSGPEGSPLFLTLLPAPQYLRFQMLLRESHHLFVSHLGEKRRVFVETEALQPRGNICGKGPRSQDPRAQSPLSWRRPPGRWLHAALQQKFHKFWGEARNITEFPSAAWRAGPARGPPSLHAWASPPRGNLRDSQIEANKAGSSFKTYFRRLSKKLTYRAR